MSYSSTVVLNAVGDIALNNRFIEVINNGNGRRIFENVKHFFDEGDINFANLDSTLSTRGKKDPKNQLVFSSSESASLLKKAGINVLSLANNHICDYGFEGCLDTVKYLHDNNINCFGVGENLSTSREPLIVNTNGITVGFLGYACKSTHGKYSDRKSYGSPPIKYSYIKRDLRKLSFEVDIKIVSLHWGFEQYEYPYPKQIRMAHRIIDAGADLIIGHHPHILQGYEIYKGKPIFYSLGNFVFDDVQTQGGGCLRWGKENKQSIIVKMKINGTKISLSELIPVILNSKLQLELLYGEEKEVLLKKVYSLSQILKGNDYDRFWKKLRVERELENNSYQIDFRYFLKNIYRIRFRHLVYLLQHFKSIIRSNVKYLLIKLGFNPSQYF